MSARYVDLAAGRDDFLADVLAGLAVHPKAIPPKYFYDEAGCRLFESICRQPEYAVTRTEQTLMARVLDEIATAVGAVDCIVEPGAGDCGKVRVLLDALRPRQLVVLDIAGPSLAAAADTLAHAYAGLDVVALGMDFLHALEDAAPHLTAGRRLIYYPGSSIGNFAPAEACALLARFGALAGADGQLLIGFDLKKDPVVLHRAYNDAAGVTAAFNLNLLARINREIGADFDLDRFRHYAFYHPSAGRIEMHLVSLAEQTIHVAHERVQFRLGESLHTEHSYKYCGDEFRSIAESAGWRFVQTWAHDGFALQLFRQTPLCDPSGAAAAGGIDATQIAGGL